MRMLKACRFAVGGLAVGALAFSGGCGLLAVEMTSAPETVLAGDPVTFDLKLTNRSQCPVLPAGALLVAFIPLGEFDTFLFGELPDDLPPEVLQFIEEVRQFFDELCTGGNPLPPEPPVLPAIVPSCHRGNGEIICELSGPAPTGAASSGSMTFATFGDRLRCEIDRGMLRCQLRLPLAVLSGETTAAVMTEPLNCFTADQFNEPVDFDAICLVGPFPAVEELGPGKMALGQVTLPARGSGIVRNLVVAVTTSEDDAGVCKGGSDAGEACDRTDTAACPGSTCGDGICSGGDNAGLGCDVATEMTDCPNGGSCNACADVSTNGLLPLDCTTTTVLAVEVAPALSPRQLASLGIILVAAGSLWLRRRRVRSSRR